MAEWDFWTVAIGGGIVGGIIGAMVESWSAYWLEGLRERKRERRELTDLALNWKQRGRPDSLRHAFLKGADLFGAKLGRDDENNRGADLSYANLVEADLQEADLQGACLYRANLRSASLRWANAQEADLSGGRPIGSHLTGVLDLSFYYESEEAATFGGTDLARADLQEADFQRAMLCGANLRWARLYGTNLCGADLRGADFYGADLRNTILSAADISGASLRKANLTGAEVSSEQLLQVDSLEGATLPDGTKYVAKPLTQSEQAAEPQPGSEGPKGDCAQE